MSASRLLENLPCRLNDLLVLLADEAATVSVLVAIQDAQERIQGLLNGFRFPVGEAMDEENAVIVVAAGHLAPAVQGAVPLVVMEEGIVGFGVVFVEELLRFLGIFSNRDLGEVGHGWASFLSGLFDCLLTGSVFGSCLKALKEPVDAQDPCLSSLPHEVTLPEFAVETGKDQQEFRAS
jgi:hypothetical protein